MFLHNIQQCSLRICSTPQENNFHMIKFQDNLGLSPILLLQLLISVISSFYSKKMYINNITNEIIIVKTTEFQSIFFK